MDELQKNGCSGFQVTIEKQSDGTYIAYNTNVDGLSLIGTGNTVSEARQDFYNSMKEVAETYDEKDVPECLKVEPDYWISSVSRPDN